ncbi:MAG: response regulator [Hellea sp.]|nr:response regulator [Hellea sp.]
MGIEAFERIEPEKLDLLLMDLSMPSMEGVKTTIRIREIGNSALANKTPFIIVSAHKFKHQFHETEALHIISQKTG